MRNSGPQRKVVKKHSYNAKIKNNNNEEETNILETMTKYDYMTTAKNFFAETYLQTAATTTGYQTNNPMVVVDNPNPDEFHIYDDKSIHGWLSK